MHFRGFFAAIAAVVLCSVMVDSAQAYPIAARRAVTTVIGVYNPLKLNLSLVDGTGALDYSIGTGPGGTNVFSFTVTLGGTYTPVGYADSFGSGDAGIWQLVFSNTGLYSLANETATDDGGVITVAAVNALTSVGRLTYVGGGDYLSSGFAVAHPEDTPLGGDFFNLYAAAAGPFLTVTCQDGVGSCNVYDVVVNELMHIGPFDSGSLADMDRLNPACIDPVTNALRACGSVNVSASSVPEPGSLALLGLALGGLALIRRRQRSH